MLRTRISMLMLATLLPVCTLRESIYEYGLLYPSSAGQHRKARQWLSAVGPACGGRAGQSTRSEISRNW